MPHLAPFPKLVRERFRNAFYKSSVKAELESRLANQSEGNIVSGQVDSQETVHLFKAAKAVSRLLSVGEMLVNQVRYSSIGAGLDGSRNQRIRRRLILVFDHG